jgi:hypothetical protein
MLQNECFHLFLRVGHCLVILIDYLAELCFFHSFFPFLWGGGFPLCVQHTCFTSRQQLENETNILFLCRPQVTIATAIIFCHRFFIRQSHANNDRRVSQLMLKLTLLMLSKPFEPLMLALNQLLNLIFLYLYMNCIVCPYRNVRVIDLGHRDS